MTDNNIRIISELPGVRSRELTKKWRETIPDFLQEGSGLGICIRNAEGALIEDVDGNVFLDLTAPEGGMNLGHCMDEVLESIEIQSRRYIHVPDSIMAFEPCMQLSAQLAKLSPIADARALLLENKGEALEYALNFARAFTGKTLAVVMDQEVGIRQEGDICRIPWPEGEEKEQEILHLLRESGVCTQAACFLLEPVSAKFQYKKIRKSFAKELEIFCREKGILLITDEGGVGISRTGEWFAAAALGMKPDMILLPRAMSAGMQLSGVIGKSALMNQPVPGRRPHMVSPVVCSAALGAIGCIRQYELRAKARVLGEYMMNRAGELKKKYSSVREVSGTGAMLSIRFAAPADADKTVQEALQHGVILGHSPETEDCLLVLPPLVITLGQLKLGMDVLERAIAK